MYLLFALIVFIIGLWIRPQSIGDIPFSQLTLNTISKAIFGGLAYLGAVTLLLKSLENDRIWPWRWSRPYLGNLIIRSTALASCIGGVWYFIETQKPDGLKFFIAISIAFIGALFCLFSDELEYFEEEKKSGEAELDK